MKHFTNLNRRKYIFRKTSTKFRLMYLNVFLSSKLKYYKYFTY